MSFLQEVKDWGREFLYWLWDPMHVSLNFEINPPRLHFTQPDFSTCVHITQVEAGFQAECVMGTFILTAPLLMQIESVAHLYWEERLRQGVYVSLLQQENPPLRS